MNDEQTARFFDIKISMTNAKKATWILLPESHQMSTALLGRGYSFLSVDGDNETILLKDQSDGKLYCFYCADNSSFEQIGVADDPSLIRLYNIVYSQLLSAGAFYDEKEAVENIRVYAAQCGYTLKEYESLNDASADNDSNFVISWGISGENKLEKHVIYFALNHSENAPPEEIRNFRHLRTVKADQISDGLMWLGKLQYVENLYVSIYNNDSFPDSLACESTLRTLELHYYGTLNYIPSAFRGIKGIERLVLASHDVVLALPDWIHECPNLRLVDLRNCHLKSIPYSLVQTGLPFIEKGGATCGVLLENVILDNGSIALFSQPRQVIESYYSSSILRIREGKVIFLGDGATGKSSLILRMVHGNFEPYMLPTDGVNITKWSTEINGEPFTLRILDFGGQEIMHSMHRCFLTAHTVYVVVCENRDDTEIDSVAARWLETVRAFAPDCPVILALNKADLNANVSVNERDLKKRNQNLKCVLKTSAHDEPDSRYGVNHLIDAIRDEIPGTVNRYRVNADMLGIKQALEDMTEDYITSARYREICAEHHITDEALQYSLLGFFRDLGVAYYYETPSLDTRLESVRVLNPEWLTNGIYRLILRTPNSGFLSHQVIKKTLLATNSRDIMPDTIYTPEEGEYILHVMREFEISHYIGKGIEMIPLKMPKTPPPTVEQFPTKDALHLRWEGAYLPNNLIHRLLIRKFPELDIACVWRTGGHFVQAGGGCEALAQMNEKALDVYVHGERDCRQYMETFRVVIQAILTSLNLKVSEVICYTVDGQEGSIPYEDVVQQYYDKRRDIYIPGIRKYVNSAELLRDTYYNWEQEAARYRQRMEYARVVEPPSEKAENPLDDEKTRAEIEQIHSGVDKNKMELTEIHLIRTAFVELFILLVFLIVLIVIFWQLLPQDLRYEWIGKLVEWLIEFRGE